MHQKLETSCASLAVVNYWWLLIWQSVSNFQTCAICLDDFREREYVTVCPCGHGYHREWVTTTFRYVRVSGFVSGIHAGCMLAHMTLWYCDTAVPKKWGYMICVFIPLIVRQKLAVMEAGDEIDHILSVMCHDFQFQIRPGTPGLVCVLLWRRLNTS